MTNEEEREQLEHETALAKEGKQVLSNRAFNAAITLRKSQIFETFCRTSHEQSDVREECWRAMVEITALEDYFRVALETGKMADITLKSMNEEQN